MTDAYVKKSWTQKQVQAHIRSLEDQLNEHAAMVEARDARIAELEAELADDAWDNHIVRLESELQDAWEIIRMCADSPAWCQFCQTAREIRRREKNGERLIIIDDAGPLSVHKYARSMHPDRVCID
jgi:hypothetical protein